MITMSIIGNLTRDPEMRTVNGANGATQVANFTVAVNNGKGKDATFVRCTAWNKQAENVGQYMKKGAKIFVSGTPKATAYMSQKANAPMATLELTVQNMEFLSSAHGDAAEAKPAVPNYDKPAEPTDFVEVPNDNDMPF